MSAGEGRSAENGLPIRIRLRCWLLGHRFYWLDANRRHHCARCGVVDEEAVRLNRLLRRINRRAGCDCRVCVTSPGMTEATGPSRFSDAGARELGFLDQRDMRAEDWND